MDLIELEYADITNNKVEMKVLKFSKDLIKVPFEEDNLFVIKIEGKSMQPMINDNSLIVADLSKTTIIDRGIYIITEESNTWVKQAKVDNDNITFIPINQEFSDHVFKNENVRVIAGAVLTFTTLS